jgi:hypothetical protein
MNSDEAVMLERAARILSVVASALDRDPDEPINALATLEFLSSNGLTSERLDKLALDVRGLATRTRQMGPTERKAERGEQSARQLEPRAD